MMSGAALEVVLQADVDVRRRKALATSAEVAVGTALRLKGPGRPYRDQRR
jgi:hypothetical protein